MFNVKVYKTLHPLFIKRKIYGEEDSCWTNTELTLVPIFCISVRPQKLIALNSRLMKYDRTHLEDRSLAQLTPEFQRCKLQIRGIYEIRVGIMMSKYVMNCWITMQ